MKIISIAIVASFLIINFSVAGTDEFCADKWPNNYRMRNYCQEQQNEGNQELFSIAKSKGLVKNCIKVG